MGKIKTFNSELERIKNNINESETLLRNVKFLENAKPEAIKNEKNKVRDFKTLLGSTIKTYNSELKKHIGDPFINYFIEEIRFNKYNGQLFSEEYFSLVNGNNIIDEEKEELFNLHKKGKLLNLFSKNLERLK